MSDLPRVVMLSLWKTDVDRKLSERMAHLLDKSYANRRYVWVVGDSEDDTELELRKFAKTQPRGRIQIVRHDTGISGSDPTTRLSRMSLTASAGLDAIKTTDDAVVIHESDLLSPRDLIERFLSTGKDVVGGWTVLPVSNPPIYYDTWGTTKDGTMFSNYPPYHACYKSDELFEVDSVGSVWKFPVLPVLQGMRCYQWGVRELSARLRELGYSIWCDPTLTIVQPVELWQSQSHAPAPL